MAPTLAIHGTELSGHTHRVELLARMLGLPYRFVDAPASVRRTPEFRALNPLGQIPVLEDGDLVLADSNAILVYLAKRYGAGSPGVPGDPLAGGRVQRGLSMAAGGVRYGPGAARLAVRWGAPADAVPAREIAEGLLRFMDDHLSRRAWLATEHPTIADLAC